jgi:hypothetical protein
MDVPALGSTELAALLSAAPPVHVVMVDTRRPAVFRRERISPVCVNVAVPIAWAEEAYLLPKLPPSIAVNVQAHWTLESMSLDEHTTQTLSALPRDVMCVVYDAASMRVTDASEVVPVVHALRAAGFTNCRFLTGGLNLFGFRFPALLHRPAGAKVGTAPLPPAPSVSDSVPVPVPTATVRPVSVLVPPEDGPVPISVADRQLTQLLCPTSTRELDDTDDDTLPTAIIPGRLFVGSALHAHNADVVARLGITVLINAAHEMSNGRHPQCLCVVRSPCLVGTLGSVSITLSTGVFFLILTTQFVCSSVLVCPEHSFERRQSFSDCGAF